MAQATARILARPGLRGTLRRAQREVAFVLVDRDKERLKAVVADLLVRGARQAEGFALDMNKTAEHAQLLQRARAALGGLDTVFIAYGTLGDQPASEGNFAVAEKELRTNFLSVVSFLTLAANFFEKKGSGTIAVISSVAGDRGRQSNYVYGTAKGALTIFLQGLRHRLAGKGVKVITIKPGLVITPMTDHFQHGALWVKPGVVARDIVRALDRGTAVVYTPWFWRWIMLVIRMVPEKVFVRTKL